MINIRLENADMKVLKRQIHKSRDRRGVDWDSNAFYKRSAIIVQQGIMEIKYIIDKNNYKILLDLISYRYTKVNLKNELLIVYFRFKYPEIDSLIKENYIYKNLISTGYRYPERYEYVNFLNFAYYSNLNTKRNKILFKICVFRFYVLAPHIFSYKMEAGYFKDKIFDTVREKIIDEIADIIYMGFEHRLEPLIHALDTYIGMKPKVNDILKDKMIKHPKFKENKQVKKILIKEIL